MCNTDSVQGRRLFFFFFDWRKPKVLIISLKKKLYHDWLFNLVFKKVYHNENWKEALGD